MSATLTRTGVANALCEALAFEPAGASAGNLTVGRGSLDGRAVQVALVENRLASGSLGRTEAGLLIPLLQAVARERLPFVLFLDSAGARVSEGLHALGAFRALFRAALDAARAGAPIAAVLGRNCYGGSSMLAHVAPRRLFSPGGQLAMSGPTILASAAGVGALDEMFRAMAEATLSGSARAQVSSANTLWDDGVDLRAWLRAALAAPGDPLAGFRRVHEALGERLPQEARARPAEAMRRKDLEKLYAQGYEAHDSEGLVTGSGQRDGVTEAFVGLMARTPVGAGRAWRFAQAALKLVASKAARVNVLLDCESHAARLDDERIVLSEYIVGMSQALVALAAGGARVELTILGRAGGGVYVALAAPAARVVVEHGAQVKVLPGAAVAAILGEDDDRAPEASESVAAGVADAEIRLGLVNP